jgi:hypothetical protein
MVNNNWNLGADLEAKYLIHILPLVEILQLCLKMIVAKSELSLDLTI